MVEKCWLKVGCPMLRRCEPWYYGIKQEHSIADLCVFSRMFLHIIGALQILKVNCTLTLKCSKILGPRPWINWGWWHAWNPTFRCQGPWPGRACRHRHLSSAQQESLGLMFLNHALMIFFCGVYGILCILSILTSYAGFGFWCCDMLFYSTMETLVNQSNEMRVFSSLICVSYIYII